MLSALRFEVSQSRGRRYPEVDHAYRNAFQRDRDRIIHARAFRRLEDKTQVFTPGLSDHFRNRLTHTIEVAQIARTLLESGLDSACLTLEITESALMADPRRALNTARRLDRMGVALSLDDFGTGYSSLQHLRRLPVREIKIDRSFVQTMASDPDDDAIVRSIIDLSKALGLRVVAEGVEDERTRIMLADAGCDLGQGWYYGRPMPAEELTPLLTRTSLAA